MSSPPSNSARRRMSTAQVPASARRPSTMSNPPTSAVTVSARGASARARRGSEIPGSARVGTDAGGQTGRRGTATDFASAIQQQGNAMKVYIRVRPFSERETAQRVSCHSTVAIDPENPAHITVLEPSKAYRPSGVYKFSRCFWSVFEKNDESDERARGAVETYLNGGMNLGTADKRRRSRAGSMIDPAGGAADAPSYVGAGSTATLADPNVPHPPYSGQGDVYQYVGQPILETVMDGYNGCIFAYGQTGSGKTFTMMGYVPGVTEVKKMRSRRASMIRDTVDTDSKSSLDEERPSSTSPRPAMTGEVKQEVDFVNTSDMDPNELQGIIPRICADLFQALQVKREEDASRSYRVEVSYYEIYNEKVYDLIKAQKDAELKIRNNPTTGPYIDGITTRVVRKEEDVTKVIRKGAQERHTAQTTYNDRSSRSHAILSITITQLYFDELNQTSKIESKLNLVDLAGSERTGAGGAEGLEKQTGIKINLSLTTLGRVIDCLADLSQNKSVGVRVPYRDSNLTWLLSDSIGGNSQTSMVATISPHTINFEEMKQTLRYASRARQIIVHLRRNEDPQTVLIRNLKSEVDRLTQLLKEAGALDFTKEEFLELQRRCEAAEAEADKSASDLSRLRAEMALAGLKDPTSTVVNATVGGADDAANAPMTASGLRATVEALQQQLDDANKELERTHQQLLAALANKADPVEVLETRQKLQEVERKYYVALEDHADKEALLTSFDQFQTRWSTDLVFSTFESKAALILAECQKMLQSNHAALQEYARKADVNALLSVNDVNQRHEEEVQALMARHQAALDTADEERAVRESELEQKHNDAIMALRNRLDSNQRIAEAEKKETADAQESMRLHYEDELTRARVNYAEEMQRLRDSLASGGTDRQKQGEALRQQQQQYEEVIAQTKKDAEAARRKLEADIDKLKTQRLNDTTQRNEQIAEKDRQVRKLEQEAGTLRRDNLSIQSEAKKMQREAQEKTRKLQSVQDEVVKLSADVLQEWTATGLGNNDAVSKDLVSRVNALRAYLQDNEASLKVPLGERLAAATVAANTGKRATPAASGDPAADKDLDKLRDVVTQLRRQEEERKKAAQKIQRDMYEQVSRVRGFQVAKDGDEAPTDGPASP